MRRSRMEKKSMSNSEVIMIKKGPWTAEEDEVLLKFVQKYGPRDWSSIRSMGLLPRTGKSCRLRWVNKLRPNLKIGCKFTAEEERVVIELQQRFGNKWATIASYLHGRTDNDVKNFWSTRQKRLARMIILPSPPLQSPPPPPPSIEKANSDIPINFQMEESSILMQIVSFNPQSQDSQPEFLIPDSMIAGLHFTNLSPLHEPNIVPAQAAENPVVENGGDVIIPAGIEVGGGGDDFLDVFPASSYETSQLLCCCDDDDDCEGMGMMGWNSCVENGDIEKLGTPDGFFDDLPADIFDCIDPPSMQCEVPKEGGL